MVERRAGEFTFDWFLARIARSSDVLLWGYCALSSLDLISGIHNGRLEGHDDLSHSEPE